jgi:hypothetical protein
VERMQALRRELRNADAYFFFLAAGFFAGAFFAGAFFAAGFFVAALAISGPPPARND